MLVEVVLVELPPPPPPPPPPIVDVLLTVAVKEVDDVVLLPTEMITVPVT
jgi:hypothetical protein